MAEEHVHGPDCDHGHNEAPANPSNPFANLDQETQNKIQEMQMIEQQFQQLLMQKNAFSMEENETDLILKELEKTDDEVFRIIGNQVVIKSSKEKLIEEMKTKKELVSTRSKSIEEQEKEMTKKLDQLRDEIMAKINA
jgi:prefoldin beta subunit